jgi:long-chain acyl-CoA synthetase
MATTLLSAWNRTVRAAGRAPAVIDAATGRTWSRAELDALGSHWAARHGEGLRGRAVLFALPNGPAWFEVFLGLLKSGAVIGATEPDEPLEGRRNLAAAAGALLWHEEALEPPPRLAAWRRNPRVLKVTSGTTGRPRILAFSDAQMLADGRQICATMGIRPRDLNLALVPLGHSYGLGNIVVPWLAQGTAALVGLPPLPQAISAAIRRWHPTVFPSVPALLRLLAEADLDRRPWRRVRLVISAGAPLPAGVAQRFHARFGRKVHNFYGSSETGGIAYDRTGGATLAGRGVGRPLEGVRLAFGRAGRFTVTSAAVFTRAGVPGPGRHRPADRGRRNQRGELVLLGRTGRMLKLAGRRLDPVEIERELQRIPGVDQALVAPHPRKADALAAVIAGSADPAAVAAALRPRLARWKIPRKFIVLEAFPLTARGKPDLRRALAALSAAVPAGE